MFSSCLFLAWILLLEEHLNLLYLITRAITASDKIKRNWYYFHMICWKKHRNFILSDGPSNCHEINFFVDKSEVQRDKCFQKYLRKLYKLNCVTILNLFFTVGMDIDWYFYVYKRIGQSLILGNCAG